MSQKTAVVAFSGGLDTSFLVPFCKEKYGIEKVITCAVDTGGFSPEEQNRIECRSKELGADEHFLIPAEEEFYEGIIKFMIYGNVTRDGYPMCVGTERLIQAKKAIELANEKGAAYVFHGSTGAGNDQYRFDCVAHVFGQGNVIPVAPVREHNITREFSTNYLKQKGFDVPEKSIYSYNVGLWGVSIGGSETHDSLKTIPDSAWYHPISSRTPVEIEIVFEQGQLSLLRVDGEETAGPIPIIKEIARIGSEFGIGRNYYTGTSIPGVKGRLAYESPAADIIYLAHSALEQITLSSAQIFGKKQLATDFGRLIHEAKMFDPWVDDLKAILTSTQRRVTGSVFVKLAPGQLGPVRTDSKFSLLKAKGACYGETAEYYSGADAQGASKLNAFEQRIWNSLNS